MSRSISVGLPDWLVQFVVAGLAVCILLWGVLSVYSFATGGFDLTAHPFVVLAFAGVWALVTVLWVRRAREWDSEGDFWDSIPREQYAGRFAEAGGLARDAWERAFPDDDEPP